MRKKILLFFCFILTVIIDVSAQTYDNPIQGITAGYYNDKFGSHGMRLGYERPVWQTFRQDIAVPSLKHALIVKANVNFYHHRRHHTGLSVNLMIGYRYTSKAGLIIEPLHIGTGYLHSFLNGRTYEVNPDGSFQEVKLAGNSTLILPYLQLIGLGYDLRQKHDFPLSFMLSLDPYFQHAVNTQTKLRLATPITITYYFK